MALRCEKTRKRERTMGRLGAISRTMLQAMMRQGGGCNAGWVRVYEGVRAAVCLRLILVRIHEPQRSQDVLLVCLDNFAIHHHLVQNEMGALQVEHDLRTWRGGWQRRRQACVRTERALGHDHDAVGALRLARLSRPTHIQLAHVLEVLVERLDQVVDELEDRKLVLIAIAAVATAVRAATPGDSGDRAQHSPISSEFVRSVHRRRPSSCSAPSASHPPPTHLIAVYSNDEEQRRVSSVDALKVSVLEEAALLLVPRQTLADDLALQRRLLGDRQILVVLRQTSLTLLVHLTTKQEATAAAAVGATASG